MENITIHCVSRTEEARHIPGNERLQGPDPPACAWGGEQASEDVVAAQGVASSPGLLATLSLAAIGRPDFLATADLGCAVLSFLSNTCYFNTQDVQLAMPFAFLPWRPLSCPQGLAWRPSGAAALLGTSGELCETTLCQADLLTAWPSSCQLASSGPGGQLLPRGTRPPLSWWLPVALTTIALHLPYHKALLQQARLELQRDGGSPRDEPHGNLAELALPGESCAGSRPPSSP
ncbi:hypothetical protein J1605_019562 [Eschrichtius robustus]|uniref:Uncharacterized protein n=1 Tax=Eschrichtius robustus TaxID=9764 RepID=A0AB34HNQ5_ESCRO|nr:hypothetical protein J1605_019562 [Eschrichtius robustus]